MTSDWFDGRRVDCFLPHLRMQNVHKTIIRYAFLPTRHSEFSTLFQDTFMWTKLSLFVAFGIRSFIFHMET